MNNLVAEFVESATYIHEHISDLDPVLPEYDNFWLVQRRELDLENLPDSSPQEKERKALYLGYEKKHEQAVSMREKLISASDKLNAEFEKSRALLHFNEVMVAVSQLKDGVEMIGKLQTLIDPMRAFSTVENEEYENFVWELEKELPPLLERVITQLKAAHESHLVEVSKAFLEDPIIAGRIELLRRLQVDRATNSITLDKYTFEVKGTVAEVFHKCREDWPRLVSVRKMNPKTSGKKIKESIDRRLAAIIDPQTDNGFTFLNMTNVPPIGD